MMATASFVATIGLFDAILVAVMEETDYQKEQFRIIHPGGAVGSLLNSQ
jgi:D-arabinose 5-phosphate isomerase GutQ